MTFIVALALVLLYIIKESCGVWCTSWRRGVQTRTSVEVTRELQLQPSEQHIAEYRKTTKLNVGRYPKTTN